MRSIHTFLVVATAILFATVHAGAQTLAQMSLINPVAVGIRGCPDGGGLTAKIFLNRTLVIETQINGSAGFNHEMNEGTPYRSSWSFAALAEHHIIFQDPSWRIYYGAGIHFGKENMDNGNYENAMPAQGIFGVDAIVGGEYLFKSVPIGISADVKPAVNLASSVTFFPDNMYGLSARYYFGRKVVVRVE